MYYIDIGIPIIYYVVFNIIVNDRRQSTTLHLLYEMYIIMNAYYLTISAIIGYYVRRVVVVVSRLIFDTFPSILMKFVTMPFLVNERS